MGCYKFASKPQTYFIHTGCKRWPIIEIIPFSGFRQTELGLEGVYLLPEGENFLLDFGEIDAHCGCLSMSGQCYCIRKYIDIDNGSGEVEMLEWVSHKRGV